MQSVLLVCDLNPNKLGTFERYLSEFSLLCRAGGVRCGLVISGEPIPPVAELLRASGAEWQVISGWNDETGRERRWTFLRGYLKILRCNRWDVAVYQFCREETVAAATLVARCQGVAPGAAVWIQHSQVAPPTRLTKWVSRVRFLKPFIAGMILLSKAGYEAVSGRGWPPTRATVIRNGIAVPPRLRRGWLRQELGLPAQATVFASVGSLIVRKGHDVLLAAVAPLLRENPERYLVIAGDGPERQALESLAASLGVGHNTLFLGLRSDVPDLLADSDLFVLASRAEGLTLAVVEAMAAELSVIVTDVGGHKEVVTPATGHLVPPNDPNAFRAAVARALADPVDTRAQGIAGRQLVLDELSLVSQVEAQFRYCKSVWAASRAARAAKLSSGTAGQGVRL
jgi:glycosyltransferase involved in cell wall biosynthesis